MKISTYTEKMNKVDGNVYVIEEEVSLIAGVYEAPLAHDNVNTSTLAVYTGPKLTGNRIQSYVLSTPSLMPWKRLIRIYADVLTVYISYETEGDTVEAEDVNLLQRDLIRTQEGINEEEERAEAEEGLLKAEIAEEMARATAAEMKLTTDLTAEIARAKDEEMALADDLAAEVTRADAAEKKVAADLVSEVDRATAAEKYLTDGLVEETTRATMAEKVLTDNLAAETTRATGAEKTLTGSLNAEVTRAEAAETANANNLAAEVTRAKAKETELQGSIQTETTRAQAAEKTLTDHLSAEVTRAKGAEKTLTDNLAAEVTRAKAAEKTNADAIAAETSRGQEAEGAIRDAVSAHTDNRSNPHGVTKAQVGLGNVPNVATNDQTPAFTQAAALANIASGEKLTVMLGKLAKALADFITHKADTVKHITVTERTNWNGANSKKHTHGNKSILDGITQALVDKWNSALTALPTHTHTKAQITDFPASLKNPSALTVSLNGISQGVYDGSAEKSVNVTASNIGAAAASHTHTKSQISDFPASLPANGGTAAYTNYINVNNIAANKDLNTITTPGLYYCPADTTVATFKNCPTTNAFFMEVGKHAGTYQRIVEYVTSSPKEFHRNYYSSAWGSWQNITVLTPVPAGAKFTDTVYAHPTTAGNKHIPTGGESGQFLKWSASGTAVWAADNDTTYGVATQEANGLMAAADKKKLDEVAVGANNYVHPSSHSGSMITQDTTHRFTTDTEKAGWNKILFSAAVTVSASGWSTSVPYTQTVSVSGLTAAMDVMLGLNITGSPSAVSVVGWKKALGMIDEGTTANGTITFKCYSKKPEINIPVYIKSV